MCATENFVNDYFALSGDLCFSFERQSTAARVINKSFLEQKMAANFEKKSSETFSFKSKKIQFSLFSPKNFQGGKFGSVLRRAG